MKVAVTGSRGLHPTDAELAAMLPEGTTEIVSGGATGVDQAAARYARAHGLKLTELRPDYKTWGKIAPLIRNSQIVDEADEVLAIWDGLSKGTQDTMKKARAKGKPLHIYTK